MSVSLQYNEEWNPVKASVDDVSPFQAGKLCMKRKRLTVKNRDTSRNRKPVRLKETREVNKIYFEDLYIPT